MVCVGECVLHYCAAFDGIFFRLKLDQFTATFCRVCFAESRQNLEGEMRTHKDKCKNVSRSASGPHDSAALIKQISCQACYYVTSASTLLLEFYDVVQTK